MNTSRGTEQLRVLTVFGDSLAIFLRNLPKALLAIVLIGSVNLFLDASFFQWDIDEELHLFLTAPHQISRGWALLPFLSILFDLIAAGMVTGVMVYLVYQSEEGGRGSMQSLVKQSLFATFAVTVLIVGIAVLWSWIALKVGTDSFAFQLISCCFILAIIWLSVVCYVAIPIMVIEDAGWGALGQSADLTKGYRPQVFGILALVTGAAFLFLLLLPLPISILVPYAILLVCTFAATVMCVTYMRLRESKSVLPQNDNAGGLE